MHLLGLVLIFETGPRPMEVDEAAKELISEATAIAAGVLRTDEENEGAPCGNSLVVQHLRVVTRL